MAAVQRWRWAERVNALCLHPWSKPLLFTLMLWPAGSLLWAAVFDQLGANPAEALLRATGEWTLRLLCVALAVTPLRLALQLPALARWRRMLGLWVYFYATLHLLSYAWFDMGFAMSEVAGDIIKRPFILVGFLAYLLLSALALTSPKRAVRALGGKNWQRLHRLIYLVAALALLHFFWMRAGKNDFAQVWLYAGIISVLLAERLRRAKFSHAKNGADPS